MHIGDGIIETPAIAAGYAITVGTTAYALYRISREEDPRAQVPKAALLTAAFFVASSLRIPVPPVSVHFVLNGLLGVLLGWYAFPSIVIGLVLQALIFGHGGVTTLGVNAVIMGLPALGAHGFFQLMMRLRQDGNRRWLGISGFVAGTLGVLIAVGLFYGITLGTLSADIDADIERRALTILSLGHLPLAFLEGGLTALLIGYLLRVKPELLPYVGKTRSLIRSG